MATYRHALHFPSRISIALITTIIASFISIVASLNLYLLEDGNHLADAAYNASPLLRFSYDGAYLCALAIGLMLCAMIGYAITRNSAAVIGGVTLIGLLFSFAAFGGLLRRHPVTFIILFLTLAALTLISFLIGRAVAARSRDRLGQRSAALLGASVGCGVALFVNLLCVTLHTLTLNPVSHDLYMQGQIPGTHLNSLLIAMVLALVTTLLSVLSIVLASRSSVRSA